MWSRRTAWLVLALTVGFTAGWVAASHRRIPSHPPPPYFGATVSPEDRDALLTVRVKGDLLPVLGWWFSSGNIRWRVFPVRPIVEALNGEFLHMDNGVAIHICGREIGVFWAPPGERPRIIPIGDQKIITLRPRWPMRAGEFYTASYSGFIGETDGIWLHKGEVLASDGWFMMVSGLKVAPYGPEFSVTGCAGAK